MFILEAVKCMPCDPLLLAMAASLLLGGAEEPWKPRTTIGIARGAWTVNGKPTHPGSRAEGLLLNVRMANAVFEDRNPATCPPGFDPQRNTSAFIARVPEYVAQGVRAFTVSLQGGHPGYAGALNSAFEGDGRLRGDYMSRVARLIEACDRAGAGVILTCFDHQQDQVLKDSQAVRRAVTEAAGWIRARGYRNVLLEIASEHPHPGYDHVLIRESTGIRELIYLAKKAAPDLLMSASGGGGGRVEHQVSIAADFLLLRFTNVPVDEVLERVASADKVSKPIVCNEDSKTGEEGASALEAAVNALASWGYSNPRQNQHHPFKYEGAADDPAVYAKLKTLTGSK